MKFVTTKRLMELQEIIADQNATIEFLVGKNQALVAEMHSVEQVREQADSSRKLAELAHRGSAIGAW